MEKLRTVRTTTNAEPTIEMPELNNMLSSGNVFIDIIYKEIGVAKCVSEMKADAGRLIAIQNQNAAIVKKWRGDGS